MVGSADLGICTHLSSSGLDLPMKIVDMFSCKVPCFAYNYPTIGELVITDPKAATGALFKTDKDLYELMVSHFKNGIDASILKLNKYSDNLDKFTKQTWGSHWKSIMLNQ